MIITFDSNVWRKVASPDNFPKDPINSDYRKIRKAIDDGKIKAFLSETIFTLEAIKKKDRKQFFKDYKADFKTDITEGDDGSIKMSFTIGPNENAHPGLNDFLKEHFADAVKLGFNIIHLPRIAGITNKEIECLKFKMKGEELSKYLDKVFEVGKRIKGLKAGDYEIEQLGLKYHSDGWMLGLGNALDSEDGVIAKAVAEWADGDSVASHIAVNGDYFCTNDSAKKAGSNSILSAKNVEILYKEYGFKKITPTELAELIK